MDDEITCYDCKHCYIDDLFYEVMCRLNHSTSIGPDFETYEVCEEFEACNKTNIS